MLTNFLSQLPFGNSNTFISNSFNHYFSAHIKSTEYSQKNSILQYHSNSVFTVVTFNNYIFTGSSQLPLLRLDIVPMSRVSKQFRVSFPKKLFVFPSSLFRPIVLPLHFNLGDNSSLQHYFFVIDYTHWHDHELTLWFYLYSPDKNKII